MIVMNLELDNLFAFENFNINFSYPKKIVNSTIPNEHLVNKPNFRYKKVNILMGSNASGKTSVGTALREIFNFISRKELERITSKIKNPLKTASFSIDFLFNEDELYRVSFEYDSNKNTIVEIFSTKIGKNDSYEICIKKLKPIMTESMNYIEKFKYFDGRFGWLFTFPEQGSNFLVDDTDNIANVEILKYILKTLDPSILDVIKSTEVENTYIIKLKQEDLVIQNGEIIKKENILSSGTKEGINLSYVVSSICKNSHGFYYCDEKFSYIQSDIEVAILSLMIELLKPNSQLFFTTHNLDVLEMNLPIHSFTFLKKEQKIEVVYPTDIIKKNDKSLRNAVKNDIFGIAPNIDLLFELQEVCAYVKE